MRPGLELLHYRLVEQIGEGGMGVVWKALDTTLGREVAIKVLPELFAQDPERLARFEREAKLLASLNHPNIATVHGLHRAPGEDGGPGVLFLAMEMVEGEDLSTRLGRGPIPVDEVAAVAVEIAAALEAAHSQGVVHRDLKPANIVMTPEGKAKVLDFGLAKAADPDAASASGSLSLSPTVTSRGTEAGVILGTAAYMSPEQARGRPVDRRADLWSFGVVLYECLTGLQVFRGETVSDSLAAVLRKEPDWSLLPADTPPMLRLLVRRCLTREPTKRLQDAGDARVELENILEDPEGSSLGLTPARGTPETFGRGRSWLPWAVAGLAVVVALILGFRGVPSSSTTSRTLRLTIPVPGPTEFGDLRASPPVLSPDGRQVVFGVTENTGETTLWVRSLDNFTARSLANTSGAAFPFWSPDSSQVGFFDTGKVKRIEVASGSIQTIGGKSSAFPRGGSWNEAGQTLYVPDSNSGIFLIDAAGGIGTEITTPDPNVLDSSHRWPCFLPDGKHFLFVAWTNDLRARAEHAGIFMGSIAGDMEPVRIVSDTSSIAFVPPGYLLVIRDGNLIALPFDPDQGRVTGDGRVIASGVLHNFGNAHAAFSASMEGTLVYVEGQGLRPVTLFWYGRDGKPGVVPGEPAPYGNIRLSPSDNRAVAMIPGDTGDGQIWVLDLERGVRTRLNQTPWDRNNPIWSHAGDRILHTSQETGILNLDATPADGSGAPVTIFADDIDKQPYDWSRDGKHVAYWPIGDGSGTPNIWIYSLETETSAPLITGESSYIDARFSPDSRWIVYVSNDSGRMEAYVQALNFDGGVKGGARWQVSTSGGVAPHWRDDGREIVYLDLENQVVSVSVEPQDDQLVLGTPEPLFRINTPTLSIDATGDHQRFLVASRGKSESQPLHVVLNWLAELD